MDTECPLLTFPVEMLGEIFRACGDTLYARMRGFMPLAHTCRALCEGTPWRGWVGTRLDTSVTRHMTVDCLVTWAPRLTHLAYEKPPSTLQWEVGKLFRACTRLRHLILTARPYHAAVLVEPVPMIVHAYTLPPTVETVYFGHSIVLGPNVNLSDSMEHMRIFAQEIGTAPCWRQRLISYWRADGYFRGTIRQEFYGTSVWLDMEPDTCKWD